MKKISLISFAIIISLQSMAQKQIQALPPARVSIFKNGTFFIKRESVVEVKDKTFYIPAPQNVLLGTWWLAAGKESPLHSIVIKTDTLKTEHAADHLYGYLLANIGENITLISRYNVLNSEQKKVSGKLLDFNPTTYTMKIEMPNGNIVIADATDFNSVELSGKSKAKYLMDSITGIAKVMLTKPVSSISASTISLEKGLQWYPSYLFTPINDKEAKLEMKATIISGDMDFKNMPVDIIIGSPEMFYGKQLDPICTGYFNELVSNKYDNNVVQTSAYSLNTNAWSYGTTSPAGNSNDLPEPEDEQKEGQKAEDLYYYQLGNLDIEKNAKMIVPVSTNTIAYSEIYTVELAENSNEATDDSPVEVYHNYKITNSTTAPFTSGSVFVLNQKMQPFAQSKMNYTPVKGNTEIRLSKAIDVQVKNEEEEIKREKLNISSKAASFDKVNYKGTVHITNYQDKKITVKVTKKLDGVILQADNKGEYKKLKNFEKKDASIVEWEIDLLPGASVQLGYQYYAVKQTY